MKKEDMIKENFADMKIEFEVNHHKISRRIDAIFADEIKHFKELLSSFNNEHCCIEIDKMYLISDKVKEIFNSCKVILVDDYESKFNKNMELLRTTMYDFFIRRISNENVRCPSKRIDRYLSNMCKFNYFLIDDKLESDLIDFANDFVYHYVNSEDAQRDFIDLVRNIHYSLICELKKVISTSIEDKQDITRRYNSLNKQIVNPIGTGR